jgi:16S rRNA (adenine1518-N6/adenine1519-N6)-dimethyltransferase
VLVGGVWAVERCFDLPPSAFRPAPRVDSTVTAWRRAGTDPGEEHLRRLRRCLAMCFAQRRRTLRNNLRSAVGDPALLEHLLATAGIDGNLRPEAVPAESYRRLAELLPRAPTRDHDALV